MPEMTPIEAAEKLEYIDKAMLIKGIGRQYDNLRASVTVAASILRKIASGEYAKVVMCKDCVYYKSAKVNAKGFLICPASGMEITDNDFCSYGTLGDVKKENYKKETAD